MSVGEFVHLHVHSQYSMLDGAIRVERLVQAVKDDGMSAVALTDHGNMYGAMHLYKACKGAGIKPILGCEVYFTADRKQELRSPHHLVLLASGQEGYKNLVRIVSLGWVKGMIKGTPVVDLEMIAANRKGIIGLTGCMGGFVAQEVLMRGPEAGRRALGTLADCFEPGNLFVELQDHGFPEQKPLNEVLVSLARAPRTLLRGAFPLLPSRGGGQTEFEGPRVADAADVAVPAGYEVEVVAEGLTFPTDVTFDEQGNVYVLEAGYSYGEVFTVPRLLRVSADGGKDVVAEGESGPWNGVAYSDGSFYVAGKDGDFGAILRVTTTGEVTTVLGGLPSLGDHHTNAATMGPDGQIYFGQGTATNAGVVGTDNHAFGWLERHPDFHDVPCDDVTLAGLNYQTENPLTDADDNVTTGAYQPFGTASTSQLLDLR